MFFAPFRKTKAPGKNPGAVGRVHFKREALAWFSGYLLDALFLFIVLYSRVERIRGEV